MTNTERLRLLLNKAVWSDEDREWLLSVLESGDTAEFHRLLREEFDIHIRQNESFDTSRAQTLLDQLHANINMPRIGTVETNRTRSWPYWAAASMIALLGIAIFLFYPRQAESPLADTKVKTELSNDVKPGGNKAVLILADGSSVMLDDAANGNIAKQGNVQVLKTADGELRYKTADIGSGEILFNTVSTPKGGQYHLVLPDGTAVWLNAASSLKFPVVFVGNERKVFLTGEGYFEVAPDKNMPFKVNVDGESEVLVTGTHFNINAYRDESAIHTTLLEGGVSVKALISRQTRSINPGQQIQQSWSADLKLNPHPNLEEVMAWKNGKFEFGDAMEFAAIMRQLSRWYDVEVIYEAPVSSKLGGSITRDVNLSDVLKMLEATGVVRFRIEGKTVKVRPG